MKTVRAAGSRGGCRTRWGIWIALACLAVTAGCGGREDNAAEASQNKPSFVPQQVEPTQDILQPKTAEPRQTPQQEAQELIRQYEAKVQNEPENSDTPATLLAIGNLYRQKLLNYKEAAFYYRQFINNYPDSPQLSLAYTQLAVCYEQQEDWRAAQLVYREMMDRFPPESPEYQYAKEKQSTQ